MKSDPDAPLDRYSPPAPHTDALAPHPFPKTWVAILLGLVAPGAGHLYAGARWSAWRGLAISAIGTTIAFALLYRPWIPLVAFVLVPLVVAIDTARYARKPEATRPALSIVLLGVVVFMALGAGFRAGLRAQIAEPFTIPAVSMAPVLLPGDVILTDKRAYRSASPMRGEVVVFRYPDDRSTHYVMRIIGMPGDEIRIENTTVWLNGAPLEQRDLGMYTIPGETSPKRLRQESLPDGRAYRVLHSTAKERRNGAWTVPPNAYFVLGDNRDNSRDSRFWRSTFVPREDLVGPVVSRYWSADPETQMPRTERIGRIDTQPTDPQPTAEGEAE